MPTRYRPVLVLVLSLVTTLVWPSPAFAFDSPDAPDPDARVYSPAFSDVPEGHVFEAPIRAVLAEGVTLGCNEAGTRFCPDSPVTRGQMAAFLTRALDLPSPTDPEDFVDDDDTVFENAIQRLAAAGITIGCNPPDNDRFCPNRPVTRGQMAAFLTRALPFEAPDAVPSGVRFSRGALPDGQRGARLEVCRENELSLMVRSVTADTADLARWDPVSVTLSAGEIDVMTDRWFLETGSGCESLDLVWDPLQVELTRPLPGFEVTSHFGPRRHPILGGTRDHTGTDLQARSGDPVLAAADGTVIGAGIRGGYGRMVEIRHAGGLDTLYAHLSTIGVSVGDVVEVGDVVGRVGCTGLCTGPHLHFETRHFGTPVDPMKHLR